MLEITLAILIDHNKSHIIYGETKIVKRLETFFGLEARQFTKDEEFIEEIIRVAVVYPGYQFVGARKSLTADRDNH